ncbi:MAG: MFS transporter [Candidatus Aminicenantes bacterium]|nr:MFS transporter [Candidatus Aminicenantes bacterium]
MLKGFIARFINVEPEKKILSVYFFLYFFLITSPFTIMKTFRNANFLHKLGKNSLPYAYLLTALIAGMVVVLHAKFQAKIPKKKLILFSLAFFSITNIVLYLVFLTRMKWFPLLYWVWVNILISVLMTHFWLVANEVFNPREIKKIIGFVGSGGILGGLLGGLLVKFSAGTFLYDYLLLISSLMLGLCLLVVSLIFKAQRDDLPDESSEQKKKDGKQSVTSAISFKSCMDSVRKSPYLSLMALIVSLTFIVSVLIDFQYNGIVGNTFEGESNLASFYGLFNAGVMVFAFLFQLFITGGMIKRLGIRGTLLFYPLILVFLSFGILFSPIIFFAIAIKASDKSLSYSVNQSIREILYIPVEPELRYRAKVFIDMFLQRFARGIGAVVVFVFIYFKIPMRFISVASLVFIVTWIVVSLKINKGYINVIKQNIQRKWKRAEKSVSDTLDLDYTKLVFDTLESKNRSEILYSMHVFDLIRQDKFTPEIEKIISQKSEEANASSFDALFGAEGGSWAYITEDKEEKEDLKTNIDEVMSLKSYQELMKGYTDKVIEKSKETEIEKMEIAKAIGLMNPDSPLVKRLIPLVKDNSPEISRYAIESAAKLRKKEFIPLLIEKLNSPMVMEDVIAALAKFGKKAVPDLEKNLKDPGVDIQTKKGIIKVLSREGNQKAADILTKNLDDIEEELEDDLIDSLDKIRSEMPDLILETKIIKNTVLKKLQRHSQLITRCIELDETEQKEISRSLSNLFKLLGLIYPHEDIMKAYQNIKSGTKSSTAYAVELLDNTLSKEFRDRLIPIIEDVSAAQKDK